MLLDEGQRENEFMSRVRDRANRLRRLILIAGIVYAIAAIGWFAWPLVPVLVPTRFDPVGLVGSPFIVHEPTKASYAAELLLFLGIILLAQWAYLRPARGWTERVVEEGRPLGRAICVAAFMAALLSGGAVALLLEIPDWWDAVLEARAGYLWFWIAFVPVWGSWAFLFWRYWRDGDEYTRLGRMIRGLVAGSFLEMFVALPVQRFVTQSRTCYCSRGSYTTLVLAGTVLLWAFGPGIVLLYARERYRRARLFPICDSCGYDLRGNASGRCPECGESLAVES